MPFLYYYLFILLVHPYLALWFKSFPLAGRSSWEALVPVYNYFVAFKLGCKKPWWSLLLFIPGVHLVMWMVCNVSYIRRFGYFSLLDTFQGIFFPYLIFFKIASNGDQILPDTNWSNSKEVAQREWGDHLVLLLTLPVIGHVLALGMQAITRQKPGTKSKVKEWGDSLLFALVAAGIIRTYVFEPFRIPTGSMERTLLVGDFLFVNKLAWGSKVPVTPLSYPLVHNDVPWVHIPSYTTIEKGTYFRLPGFSDISVNDVMVFNYPSGDTAVYDPRMPSGLMGHDYHGIVNDEAFYLFRNSADNQQLLGRVQQFYIDSLSRDRTLTENVRVMQIDSLVKNFEMSKFISELPTWKAAARDRLAIDKLAIDKMTGQEISHYGLIERPVDKRENYIKRCVAMPGDYMEIKNSILYINDKPAFVAPNQNLKYNVSDPNFATSAVLYEKFGLEDADLLVQDGSIYAIFTNLETIGKLRKSYPKISFTLDVQPRLAGDPSTFTGMEMFSNLQVFPKDPKISNNMTNFQRIRIPYKGMKVDFSKEDIAWYRRIITSYEGHKLEEKSDGIYIDGKKTNVYTVEMNYYWLMGDNRYNSADSRVWGFVPEDHIVGRASLVWFSSNPTYGIRWERLFKLIK